ncbi:MAG TPA: PQQ-dependent sugar dehydrogenase [Nitrososphaeraceae archaeon]|nr:PQQ-dependent sugar dehydrogenase [Nitrososphaeraceae archaeon]
MTIVIASMAIIVPVIYLIHNSSTALAVPSITKDSNLKVETLVNGLSYPTSMAFIDNNDILVLEKGGQVRLVSNGVVQDKPVLQVSVDTESERGLLGIAIMNVTNEAGNATTIDNNNKFVFLYFTESNGGDLRNRVYRYNWNEQTKTLVNPTLVLDLPALPGPNHDGGKLVIGPDHYLYVVIGDLNHRGKLQNIRDGPDPDDTSVIFRVEPNNGSAAKDNPFIHDPNIAMHKYYAYGIRNSFGIAFDPITGNLWQTENGPDVYDEINIVKPGFNSGWIKIMGPLSRNPGVDINQLVNFAGSHYVDPVFSWKNPIAVTDIEFMKSSMLGEKYKNNIFVGDYNNGNLYYFEVNSTRTGIMIKSDLSQGKNSVALPDLVVDNDNQLSAVTFGTGFGGISDIKTGPTDGFLYVLSIDDGGIYKIVPSSTR